MESNYFIEKVLSILRRRDMQVHRRSDVITVAENAVREEFYNDPYLRDLAERESPALEKQAVAAAAAKAKADAVERDDKRKEAERAAKDKKAARIAANAAALVRVAEKNKLKNHAAKIVDEKILQARAGFDHVAKHGAKGNKGRKGK